MAGRCEQGDEESDWLVGFQFDPNPPTAFLIYNLLALSVFIKEKSIKWTCSSGLFSRRTHETSVHSEPRWKLATNRQRFQDCR